MPLETGTYISDLVAANPLNTDGSGQGDDHIRLLKSTILASFPNITGAVTATHTILNGLDARVTAVEGAYVKKDGSVAMTGALNMGSQLINSLATPVSSTDAATKAYADLMIPKSMVTTRGDLLRGGALGAVERVALGTNGQVLKSDGTDAVWANPTALISAADTSNAGIVELATTAETTTGTDTTRAVTPAGLAGSTWAPKVWVSFNGATATIKSSQGVTSVTRNSAGDFTVTFSSAFADTNYCPIVTRGEGGKSFSVASAWTKSKLVGSIGIRTMSVTDTGGGGNQANDDETDISLVIFSA